MTHYIATNEELAAERETLSPADRATLDALPSVVAEVVLCRYKDGDKPEWCVIFKGRAYPFGPDGLGRELAEREAEDMESTGHDNGFHAWRTFVREAA